MNRLTKLNMIDHIPLGDGENPPANKINPDYVQQPSNRRACILCGKMHDMIVECQKTGARLEEIDKCYDCFWKNAFIYKPPTEKIQLTVDNA